MTIAFKNLLGGYYKVFTRLAREPEHYEPESHEVKIHFTSCLRDTDKDLVSHASQKALNDSVAELADLDCQMHTKILSLRAYIYEVVEPSLPREHGDKCLQSLTLAIMPTYDITVQDICVIFFKIANLKTQEMSSKTPACFCP